MELELLGEVYHAEAENIDHFQCRPDKTLMSADLGHALLWQHGKLLRRKGDEKTPYKYNGENDTQHTFHIKFWEKNY